MRRPQTLILQRCDANMYMHLSDAGLLSTLYTRFSNYDSDQHKNRVNFIDEISERANMEGALTWLKELEQELTRHGTNDRKSISVWSKIQPPQRTRAERQEACYFPFVDADRCLLTANHYNSTNALLISETQKKYFCAWRSYVHLPETQGRFRLYDGYVLADLPITSHSTIPSPTDLPVPVGVGWLMRTRCRCFPLPRTPGGPTLAHLTFRWLPDGLPGRLSGPQSPTTALCDLTSGRRARTRRGNRQASRTVLPVGTDGDLSGCITGNLRDANLVVRRKTWMVRFGAPSPSEKHRNTSRLSGNR